MNIMWVVGSLLGGVILGLIASYFGPVSFWKDYASETQKSSNGYARRAIDAEMKLQEIDKATKGKEREIEAQIKGWIEREASGNFSSPDPVAGFLYLLGRDHLPLGQIERLVDDITLCGEEDYLYTDGWHAKWAVFTSERLRAGQSPKIDGHEEHTV